MRKPAQIAVIAAVVLLGATTALFVKYRQTHADYLEMKLAEESSRARYDRTLEAIVEIQDSLNTISIADPNVKMISEDLSSEQKLSETESREALDRIALLRASIKRSTDRIRQLESSLKANGIKVGGLQRMIANLKQSVSEKQELVTQLTGQVENLNTQVAGLQTEVQQQQQTLVVRDQDIEQKRRELATVMVAIGSKRQLTESGVVIARGGVLGLGKTLLPAEQASDAAFTPIDTDQETVVRTPAARIDRVRVLSPQPPSSYELREVNGVVELHILNPLQFRKVKQLVILTA